MPTITSIFCAQVESNTPFTNQIDFNPAAFPNWHEKTTKPSIVPIVSEDLNSSTIPFFLIEEVSREVPIGLGEVVNK